MKTMTILLIIMVASLLVASVWNSVPVIKDTVHLALDPTAGALLNWNTLWGMFLLVLIISIIMTLVHKYGTDQETLREMKKEQKMLQEEAKKYRDNPEKVLEINKKMMAKMPEMMGASMKPLVFTFIPFVLFFRWFHDFFSTPELVDFRFFGFLSWFWFYLIASIIFSSILRKVFKVV